MSAEDVKEQSTSSGDDLTLDVLFQLYNTKNEDLKGESETALNYVIGYIHEEYGAESKMELDAQDSSDGSCLEEDFDVVDGGVASPGDSKPSSSTNGEVSSVMEDSTFACGVCGEILTQNDSVSEHMKEHENGEKKHKCETCGKLFSTEALLSSHLETHKKKKLYKCLFCEETFENKTDWVSHMCAHAAEQDTYFCDVCGNAFRRINDLTRHKNIHADKKSHKCEVCNETFSCKTHLLKHARMHKKKYQCLICHAVLYKKGEFSLHMKTHDNDKFYKKKKHEKALRLEDVIKNVRFHKNEKTWRCEYCQKTFDRKADLLKHEKMHIENKPFQCEFCEKTFRRKNYLQRHLGVHEKRQQFKCNLRHLAPNFQTPIVERSYKGQICDREFCLKEDTIQRVQAELKVKPFQCDECLKTFTRKSDLTRHEKTHSSVRLFRCQFCQKAFTRRDNLVTHMQIYKNERPHKCGICEKAFVRKGDMMQHMNTHTNEKPYSCDICKKTFTRRADLSRHKRTMHKIEENSSFMSEFVSSLAMQTSADMYQSLDEEFSPFNVENEKEKIIANFAQNIATSSGDYMSNLENINPSDETEDPDHNGESVDKETGKSFEQKNDERDSNPDISNNHHTHDIQGDSAESDVRQQMDQDIFDEKSASLNCNDVDDSQMV